MVNECQTRYHKVEIPEVFAKNSIGGVIAGKASKTRADLARKYMQARTDYLDVANVPATSRRQMAEQLRKERLTCLAYHDFAYAMAVSGLPDEQRKGTRQTVNQCKERLAEIDATLPGIED